MFTYTPTSSGASTFPVTFPDFAGSASSTNVNITTTSDGVRQSVANSELTDQNYPNPFSTETIIPMSQGIIGTLQLFNECGIKMDVTYSQTENGIVIERGNLPAGIYFYRFSEAERGTIAEGSVVIGN